MAMMDVRTLRRECERFTNKVLARGASPVELAGLMIGALARLMRDNGRTREKFLEACALLWDNNNPADPPVADEPTKPSN
jgi:hypothetical protein